MFPSTYFPPATAASAASASAAVQTGLPRCAMAEYAKSPDGDVYVATGVQDLKRWDDIGGSFVSAGVPAPSTNISVAQTGTGDIVGTYYVYQRWLDADGRVSNLSPISTAYETNTNTGSITAASNASPIVITSAAHGKSNDDVITIYGVIGNLAANGRRFVIKNKTTNTFEIENEDGSATAGSGDYVGGGTWIQGASQLDYTSVDAPTDARVVTRQILRNKDGNASVFYVDVESTDLAATTFTSTNNDAALGAAVTLVDTAGDDLAVVRHAEPPNWMRLIAHHYGRMWLTGVKTYREGAVNVSNGSASVQGIGTSFTTDMAGWSIYIGSDNTVPFTIDSVDTANQTLTLSANYDGTTSPFIKYSMRKADDERRALYASESLLPESFNLSRKIVLQENPAMGEITGLLSYRTWLYLLCERMIYQMHAGRGQPDESVEPVPVLWRGCLNQRCWEVIEGVAYSLDRKGAFSWRGGSETENIGIQIQPVFEGGGKWAVNWKRSEHFHTVHDPQSEVIWHFVSLGSSRYPQHALCYHYRHKRWWIAEFPFPITSSCLGEMSGVETVFLGTTDRRVLVLNRGSLDVISKNDGTHQGTATSAAGFSLTDSGATFDTTAVGAYVRIVSGTGAGQERKIVAQTSTVLTIKDPWTIIPDTTSVYQIGAIRWYYKTGKLRYSQGEGEEKRGWEVEWSPTEDSGRLVARTYADRSTTADVQKVTKGSNTNDGIGVTKGSADMVIDINKASGAAVKRGISHRSVHADGARFVALELEGVTNEENHRISEVIVNGTESR